MAHGYKLLTPDNPKVEKGRKAKYWTFVLHLAPAQLSGFEVCPMRTAGCTLACLNTAGRGGMIAGRGPLQYDDVLDGTRNAIQRARIRRTRFYFEDRDAFMVALFNDVTRAIRKAKAAGYRPAFRLNATSDIRWELARVPVLNKTIFELFPRVQFYDYTKILNRRNIPANYHLTFSLADGNDNQAQEAMRRGMNVAAVFRDKATVARYVAAGFNGYPVAIGDDTDLRFRDPAGHVIALYAKGNARKDQSGFVKD